MGHVTSDVTVASMTSAYVHTSFSTGAVSSTSTLCSLAEKQQQECSTASSQLPITEQALMTQYSTVMYSSTIYQNSVIPPYVQFGFSPIQFVTVTALEFGLLVGTVFFMLRRSRRPPTVRSQRIPELPPPSSEEESQPQAPPHSEATQLEWKTKRYLGAAFVVCLGTISVILSAQGVDLWLGGWAGTPNYSADLWIQIVQGFVFIIGGLILIILTYAGFLKPKTTS